MIHPTTTTKDSGEAWDALEPYAQVIRSLMPRAAAVVVFDGDGQLRWSSETTTGPDLVGLIDETLFAARTDHASPGTLRLLAGDVPVYVFWIRSNAGQLIAIVGVVCRAVGSAEGEHRPFSFVHSLLRPALECLRRELIARAAIDDLSNTVTTLDRDLALLLAEFAGPRGGNGTDGADDLKAILQSATEHLGCPLAALIVPEKSIVQMRTHGENPPDRQLVARTHRQLLSMAQMRREPVIINRLQTGSAALQMPYRILSCPVRHASGRVMGVLAVFRNEAAPAFTERDARLGDVLARRAAAVIESSFDALSGLYTRPAFEQRARAVLAGADRNARWSALYIDSDQLHAINDNFGMHVGDSVIGQIGELIRRRLPPGAFASRISGDRFAILLPSAPEDAATFADSLREGVERLGAAQDNSRLHVSISIGVAPVEPGSVELTHSLAAAEMACKAAKDRGRNRVEVYQTADVSIVRRFTDINIATRLRAAIEEGRMRLYAQLILPLGTVGHDRPHYEILLRMVDEDGETFGPDRFLLAANRYQLMPTLDRWVIEQTIARLRPHRELLASAPAVFAINFSGQSLNNEEFADFLLEQIEGSGLPPELFCFELTENATIANLARAEVIMRRLRRIGCGIALDDFGTGLSSLSYLRQLPVTMLKIDGSFVRDILKDPRSESMVHAIAQLARAMSLATVAEYVETEELRSRVAALGVDYGQGFAIGRPLPFEEIMEELPVLAAASPVCCPVEEALPQLRTGSAY